MPAGANRRPPLQPHVWNLVTPLQVSRCTQLTVQSRQGCRQRSMRASHGSQGIGASTRGANPSLRTVAALISVHHCKGSGPHLAVSRTSPRRQSGLTPAGCPCPWPWAAPWCCGGLGCSPARQPCPCRPATHTAHSEIVLAEACPKARHALNICHEARGRGSERGPCQLLSAVKTKLCEPTGLSAGGTEARAYLFAVCCLFRWLGRRLRQCSCGTGPALLLDWLSGIRLVLLILLALLLVLLHTQPYYATHQVVQWQQVAPQSDPVECSDCAECSGCSAVLNAAWGSH